MARMKNGGTDMFRCIPTVRVKQFVEAYITANYPKLDNDEGYGQFCFDSGVNARKLHAIRKVERPNLSFDFVDKMLTRLDMLHIWHLSPEEGGFADYYHPDIPPAPAEANAEQTRLMVWDVARQSTYRKRLDMTPLDVLHEHALKEDEERVAA